MTKKVKLYIKSSQSITIPMPDGELQELADDLLDPGPMVTEIESEGEFEYADGVITITYTESAVTGLENCITAVSFSDTEPDRVTLYRSGAVKTALMFCEGQRYISVYDTGFGCFEVGIFTEKCENRIGPDGGELSILYTVEIRGSEAERTELIMKVRELQ